MKKKVNLFDPEVRIHDDPNGETYKRLVKRNELIQKIDIYLNLYGAKRLEEILNHIFGYSGIKEIELEPIEFTEYGDPETREEIK